MKKIKIAGVPEHFNLPWHLAIEDGAFENRGIDLEWTEVPEGTGRMCTMLREGETDIAIILTEGIVKDIVAGNPSKIVQVFVQSPLYWGIHVAANSSNKKVADLKDKKAAISRYGSGSHLMAVVNANNNGWSYKNLEFEVVNNVDGAIEALNNGTADYFMWEHFTTKPLVDKGVFRRVDDCPTPWPCFVIAVTDKLLEKSPSLVNHILEVINTYTEDFKDIPSIDRMLANRYEQKVEDIQEWLSITRWSQENITPIMVKNIQEQLERLAIIEKTLPYSKIVTKV
ncbi:substrate-binding domain-containing protein [Galbibacter orientalis]|uniref:substrate-binding domain-containing protein n=1 Tax=Galbibacter orientalis TaxID=453852 RepID=UPI003080AE20